MKKIKIKSSFDWTLIIIPVILAVAGIATLYTITPFSGRANLAEDQFVYFLLGIVVYIVLAILDYHFFESYTWYLYLVGFIFLLAVGVFGQSVFGSRRWIDFGFFQFQPSELVKVALLVLSCKFFGSESGRSPGKIAAYLLFCAIPIFFILREPDLGTALTISFMVIAVLIAARVPRKFLIISAALLIAASPFVWMKLKPYQKERIASFVNPARDPLGSGYNVSQAKIAVGSGGLIGKGFGGATQSQLQFLPVAHIDFIFAGWAESTGFIGSIILVLLIGVLIWRIFSIAGQAKDRWGYIFCTAAGAVIFFQSFVNIGMNIGLMPVTGIPLPLLSYGGTSFLITSAILGIVQSIYLRRQTLKFD